MNTVTRLLIRWRQGDTAGRDELFQAVQHELHRIAYRYMQRERDGHLLQATALVNEAYLRLIDQPEANWQNRAHFFAISAHLMRQILVDHARGSAAHKRGGALLHLPLDEGLHLAPEKSKELLALDEALTALALVDRRKADVVELRYFGGLEVEEVAELLKVHPNTVIRDWRLAKAWLKRKIDTADRTAS
jgi:RNA polymerase sigma-70 factor (ECF subfamily)